MIIISFIPDEDPLMRDGESIVLNTTIMANRSLLKRGKRLVELEDGRVNISESLLFGDSVYNERNNLHKST
jgi:hypothetical protein